MKIALVIILPLFLSSSFGSTSVNYEKSSSSKEVHNTSGSTVMICTGKYSKRYHNSMCRGMKACKGEVKKVSLSDAKRMGLTRCGYCYGR